jgi:hypothetical protein
MVVSNIGTEQLFVPELFQRGGGRGSLEFSGDAQAKFPGEPVVLPVQPRKHSQGYQLVVGRKEALLQTFEILGPLVIPRLSLRRSGGVHGADAGIEQCLNRLVGMRGRAGIVGVVDHASDTGVNATERGDQIADIHVARTVIWREALMCGCRVFCDIAVGNDTAEHAFPGMAVAVDETGDQGWYWRPR